MSVATDRLDFAPPATGGLWLALTMAIVVHGLLVAALTWGVQWRREAPVVTVQAELWSAVPQDAAPPSAPVTPEAPSPEPDPVPEPAPAPEPAPPPDVNIVEKPDKPSPAERPQPTPKKPPHKASVPPHKPPTPPRQTPPKPKDSPPSSNYINNVKQMLMNAAEGTGTPQSVGTSPKSSGLSAGYAGRMSAYIKRYIVFTEEIAGNPVAVVTVHTAPDGSILSRKIKETSGVRTWDDAVLRAIDKAGMLPRDTDGRVPPTLEISFRPKD